MRIRWELYIGRFNKLKYRLELRNGSTPTRVVGTLRRPAATVRQQAGMEPHRVPCMAAPGNVTTPAQIEHVRDGRGRRAGRPATLFVTAGATLHSICWCAHAVATTESRKKGPGYHKDAKGKRACMASCSRTKISPIESNQLRGPPPPVVVLAAEWKGG